MWNQVVLVASGLACGWSLVHLWSVPAKQVRGQRIRLALGLLAGLSMVVWLAVSSLAAAVVGLMIMAGTALVAYAANARQVNRIPQALPPHEAKCTGSTEPRTVVILVTGAEPRSYNGPEYWARAFLDEPNAPHWFLRPRTYARVRRAYAFMGDVHPLSTVLDGLLERIYGRLGPIEIRVSWLGEERTFLADLVGILDAGFNRLVLLPLEQEPRLHKRLHELVERSGINDALQIIAYSPAVMVTATALPERTTRLERLAKGLPVQVPLVNEKEELCIAGAVAEGLNQAEALSWQRF